MSSDLPQNIHLRRIHWAITSPSLMNYHVSVNYIRDAEHQLEVLRLIQHLDTEPELVDAHFDGVGKRPMGKYFEQLLFFLIEKDPRFDLILSNQQIKEGNRTIGEIDLIVKDAQTKKIEHWEICLKFYLQSLPSSDPSLMLGPNAVDNLARKSDKLLNHQLPLAKHSSLKYLTGTHSLDSKLFMKGQLFYHLNELSVSALNVSKGHESGWWCFLSEVRTMLEHNLKWTTLWKPDWIGRHSSKDDSSLLSNQQLVDLLNDHFKSNNNSILTVGMTESEDGWLEQTRGFIVNEDWPHLIPQQG